MIRIALSTFSNEDEAARVVHRLVEEHLAACGTLLPAARSIYRWKDAVEDTAEVVVLFKVPAPRFETFTKRLLELHPYDTPELLAWEAPHGSKACAEWAFAACGIEEP